jgi:signal transduction histidine kinase
VREREADLEENLLTLFQDRSRWQDDEKSAALGRLSHAIAAEIRDPVTRVSTAVASAKQLTGSKQHEALLDASEELDHLVSVLTDFLRYAQLQNPRLMPVSLVDLTREVVEYERSYAAEKSVHLQVESEDDLMVGGDAAQLRQALSNVVKNAIEACPATKVVAIKMHASDERARVDVENPGQPIAEQERSQLFEPFFTTKTGATGMGLSIARKIARAHGGDLALVANDPHRICFSLILPSAQVQSQSRVQEGVTYPSVHI